MLPVDTFPQGESFGNDPPNKDNNYKSWMSSVMSVRPIRGQNYRTPILRVTADWEQMKIDSSEYVVKSNVEVKPQVISFHFPRVVLFSQEVRNDGEDYMDAPWTPTFDVETIASHK